MKVNKQTMDFLIQEEGFKSKMKYKQGEIPERLTAYDDTRGILTTGFGNVVARSKDPVKRKQEVAEFTKKHGVDPYDISKEDAYRLKMEHLERETLPKINKDLGAGTWDKLDERVQQAVVSLVYNTGKVGPNTAKLINKAVTDGTKDSWGNVAKAFGSWHGNKEEQNKDLLGRRSREAQLIHSYALEALDKPVEGLKEEPLATPQVTPTDTPEESLEFSTGEPTELTEELPEEPIDRDPSSELGTTEEPEVSPNEVTEGTGYDVFNSKTTQQGLGEQLLGPDTSPTSASDVMYQVNEDTPRGPYVSEVKPAAYDFRDSMNFMNEEAEVAHNQALDMKWSEMAFNSFVTENVVGSTINAIAQTSGESMDNYGEYYDPTKSKLWSVAEELVDPKDFQTVIEGIYSDEQLNNRLKMYINENRTRDDISRYMAENPISGFAGIGLASAIDITSIVPVGGVAKAAGLISATKNLSKTARVIGGAIGTNLVQDMLQETILLNNSQIRKFEDGDVLIGAAASVIMGGVAGKFKLHNLEGRMYKLTDKYAAEKNLTQIEAVINRATKNGYSDTVLNDLKKVRAKVEQDFDLAQKNLVMDAKAEFDTAFRKEMTDNFKMDAIKKQAELEADVELKVDAEKAKYKTIIADTKNSHKLEKVEVRKPLGKLEEQAQGIRNRIKSLKSQNVTDKVATKLANFNKQLDQVNSKISSANKDMKKLATKHKNELAKVVKSVKKLEISENLNENIANLRKTKDESLTKLRSEYRELVRKLDSGEIEASPINADIGSFNDIIKELGVNKTFKDLKELDEFLGIRADEPRVTQGLTKGQSMGAAGRTILNRKADASTVFKSLSPEMDNVISASLIRSNENPSYTLAHLGQSNGKLANILRFTYLNKLLSNDNFLSRAMLNKNTYRASENEFARAFYDLMAPAGLGRMEGAGLSLMEQKAKVDGITIGAFRESFNDYADLAKKFILGNDKLKEDLGLPNNPIAAKVSMFEAYFDEKLSRLMRDELIDNGTTLNKYGPEFSTIVTDALESRGKVMQKVLKDMKDTGVKGAEDLAFDDNYMHRSWDNKKVRAFINKPNGEASFINLIENSMVKHFNNTGVVLDEKAMASVVSEARKFALGLANSDLNINTNARLDLVQAINRIIDMNLVDVDTASLNKAGKNILDQVDRKKKAALARRKPLELTGEIDVNGQKVRMVDFLESNMLQSDVDYLQNMNARIVAAKNGISDINQMDEVVDAANTLERARGSVEAADQMIKNMREDLMSFKYGSGTGVGVDAGLSKFNSFVRKYSFARLMQYYGISSIAETGTLVGEAGYKSIYKSVDGNMGALFKSYVLGGMTGKIFSNNLYKALKSISGLGLETMGFDPVASTSRRIYSGPIMGPIERTVDNLVKGTRRASGHVEVTNRRLALNSLAMEFTDIATGESKLDSLWGGLSYRNLKEFGLGKYENGKFVFNDKYNTLIENIKKSALDEDGNLITTSKKKLDTFDFSRMDQGGAEQFGDLLQQWSNHIMVNPDSTTSKWWHTQTLAGNMASQYKSFSINAASKVAGHSFFNTAQGLKDGSAAELAKLGHKLFWSAVLGKLSLTLFSGINNAGREDFQIRMAEAASVNSFYDWTQALGRGSIIAGLDSPIDTALGAYNLLSDSEAPMLFNSSTVGRSRSSLDLGTTATGQLLTGSGQVLKHTAKREWSKAGNKALNLTPLRRQVGLNQLFNMMGLD